MLIRIKPSNRKSSAMKHHHSQNNKPASVSHSSWSAHLLQPQKPPPPVALVAAGAVAAFCGDSPGAGTDVGPVVPVSRPNMPIAAAAGPPPSAVLWFRCSAGGVSPGASPKAFRSCSSFCLASSASCLATASAVFAAASSSRRASLSLVGIGGGGGGATTFRVEPAESRLDFFCIVIDDARLL